MKKLIIGTIFIAVLSLVFGAMNIYNAPAASVILDVNPSIEIVTNRLDTVIEVRALNNDAEKMLEDFQLDDRDIESVVDELVDLMISTGYITGGEDNLVMLTVYEENANQEVLDRMNKQIRAYLENQKISATILNQVAKESDEDQDGQTSTGKNDLINKLVDSDDELNYNDLASISIKDIILMSENTGLTPEDLFLQVVEKAEQNISNAENTYISTEEARNIARELTNGGQVVEFKIGEDDSEVYYKVEVFNESGKYEIEIDAMTGKVIEFELDEIDDMYNKTLISRDEAIEIAKEISGSGKIEIELDEDDGYFYEVEVKTQTGEYEIEIDAVTGEVIKFEVEKEYDNMNEDMNEDIISRDEAIEIARGISDSGEIEIELEEDDDRYIYEVEVKTETSEYEIEIDAVTGEVIKFEVEKEYNNMSEDIISRDEAIEIARGISDSGEIEIELEEDDDRYIYEVEVKTETSEYEIEIDAITGEVIELEVDEEYEMLNQELISKDEAIDIVKEISGDGQIDIELDDDDEKYIYEVEVENETGEYEIVIDAVSGEVIELEIDEEYKEDEEYEENVGELISEEEAKSIALQESNGGNVEDIELDEDDGQYIYEIEIVKDEMEYEFEINAHSGEIIKVEIDD